MCLNQYYNYTLVQDGLLMQSLNHTISISNYNPLAGRSYINLSKELDHPRKGLIALNALIMNALNGVWSNT